VLLIVINMKKAIMIFEKVAHFYCKNPTNSNSGFKCKTIFVDATLCRLCLDDVVETKKSITKYAKMLDDFKRSREYKLFDSIIHFYEKFDAENFQKSMTEFCQISTMKKKE